ncbi:MAG: hypothetical protein A2W61_06045 [Deltaproteobacteria bacterium RIFCSPLOWO2_01_44_7]|nr:MAG: hypothetical protein A2712_06265 [Deltaproteobacteria bacterium RIFCSPHIGHO2_01_FULL_43_49]OGQ16731.1 MAG: hypothetical protein A3D22_07390 [Deltaproteobacteria bacterium RIFCSPHIGHO2_02_FULL_44_53]OGQ29869.1 MAG: hypothetical protein A3D98_10055 [Deltaproteobacteria bacterium RIFCSPHIGHO2_12_FULL_44_21]OGQ33159.1 MAG: hypothetical protein A2979_04035 [Deltaproteobacteria bacterium RIFCSPLOWO2_01_FULL_45_74]OGQ42299.1 MAG: hypothetical protein A2W61_06045 [Deltaproteobacteria bacterium 
MKKTFTILICFCLVLSQSVFARSFDSNRFTKEAAKEYAQNESQAELSTIERKQKSKGLAIGLGLSPIPGDGLIYTGHPVQGALSMLLGVVGGITLGVGLFGNCNNSGDPGDCRAIGNAAKVLGGITYGTAYLWDAIGSAIAAKKFKK